MILLQANKELRQTFEKLITTTKAPVKWNGIFAVLDNYVILQGEVRSLFFHFDSRKVTTNLIEIPEQLQVMAVGENLRVQNALHMILYAFGKWGTIKGIRVEKDYAQLNQLFAAIMREYEAEPEYTPEYMRFYRKGMRITYEDVIQMAIEYRDTAEREDSAEGSGLWHKIIWKRAMAAFTRVDTTVEERKIGRLGNNFYMVGYLCPFCGKNLHMAVYPEGKEFLIETEEGGVLLARAATCAQCHSFFTPRPQKLFAEGDIYQIEFGEDTAAYEDYMELLGREAARVSNCRCNVYADGRSCGEEDAKESLEALADVLPALSERELRKLEARMEEGFYPDESTARYEVAVKAQAARRMDGGHEEHTHDRRPKTESESGKGDVRESAAERKAERGQREMDERFRAAGNGSSPVQGRTENRAGRRAAEYPGASARGYAQGHGENRERMPVAGDRTEEGTSVRQEILVTPQEQEAVRKKYGARMQLLERYSERQLKELKGQLTRERQLPEPEKAAYLAKIEQRLGAERLARLTEKTDACEGKKYIVIKRTEEEVAQAAIPQEQKTALLEKLVRWKKQQAEREVCQLIQKMPQNLDRSQYKAYMERIKEYEGVDISSYEEVLNERRMAAEKQEIVNVVKRARKVSREDWTELSDRLREGDYLPELILPYMEKINDRIRELDAEAIALICPEPMQMTYEEGMEAYEQIAAGDFLPELKNDALKQLSRRLAKIKTDECELLVQKLKEDLKEAGVADCKRHHFYPARRALLQQAAPQEVEVIAYALASYAAGRGLFEYPVFVADTSRDETGKEGILLTPEHLYYSTLFQAYGVPVASIARIEASAGLFKKGLYMYQKDGTKTKLPYAVDGRQLDAFATVLDAFVHYLQEKPDSRSLSYLAREKHEEICCFRCGYAYKGGSVCPKCGYQNNE